MHNLPLYFTHRCSTRKSQKYSAPCKHLLHCVPPPSPHPLPPTVELLLKMILIYTERGRTRTTAENMELLRIWCYEENRTLITAEQRYITQSNQLVIIL